MRERTSHCPVPGCDYLSYSVHGVAAHVRLNHPSYAPTETGWVCVFCEHEPSFHAFSGLAAHIDREHAFEDYPNPIADQRLADGIERFLSYQEKRREFERLYPDAEEAA